VNLQELTGRLLDEVERAVVGKRKELELVLLGLLADGHVLLDDFPGLAKTLTARSFARVTSMRFARVQFTPDLMPSDVTGSSVYNQRLGDFEFRPGPVFTNLLLGDEINRSPPKTQAALLEAMQERQVTIDGVTRRLEPPFLVIATQNPIEYEGTYPLPEAQLDRFLLRLSVGYPSPEAEWGMLERRLERTSDEVELAPVATPAEVLAMQRAIEDVHVASSVGRYMVELVGATRASPRMQVGASPRGTLALLKVSRAKAAMAGRDFVTPEDVKAVAVPALAHRLILRPELWVRRVRTEDVVAELLEQVPTPPPEAEPAAVRPGPVPSGDPPGVPRTPPALGVPRTPPLTPARAAPGRSRRRGSPRGFGRAGRAWPARCRRGS
jgi:MoxR-like ATPase